MPSIYYFTLDKVCCVSIFYKNVLNIGECTDINLNPPSIYTHIYIQFTFSSNQNPVNSSPHQRAVCVRSDKQLRLDQSLQ